MSMERFLCIASPFGYTKLNQKTAKISLVLIWGLGLIMAIVPGAHLLSRNVIMFKQIINHVAKQITAFRMSIFQRLYLSFLFLFVTGQCCIGGSRRTTTAPMGSAFHCTSASHFPSAVSIPLSSSWVSIVYGKDVQQFTSSFPHSRSGFIPPFRPHHSQFNRAILSDPSWLPFVWDKTIANPPVVTSMGFLSLLQHPI